MNEEIWICPECQSENPADAAFCGECGTPKEKVPVISDCTLCPVCGAQNVPTAAFCGECGSQLKREEPKQKVCRKCKLIYPTEKRFCLQCGEVLVEKETLFRKTRNKKDWLNIGKHFILPFIALLFLVFAFLPIYQFDFGKTLDIDTKIPIRYTAIDNIVMLFDAAKNESLEDLQDTRLFNKIEDLNEKIENIEDDNLTNSQKRIVAKVIKLTNRLLLQSEDEKISAYYIINAIISLLYISFAILFFVFSFLHFIRKIKGCEVKRNLALHLLSFSPFAILLPWFMMKKNEYMTPSLNIIPLILVSMFIIGFIVFKIIKEKKFNLKGFIFKTISVTLSIVLICISLSSVFSVEMNGKFKDSNNNRTVKTSFDFSYYLTHETEVELIENLIDNINAEDIRIFIENIKANYTAKEVKDGKADEKIKSSLLMTSLFFGKETSISFSLMFYLILIFSVFISVFGSNNLYSLLMIEKEDKKILNIITSSISIVCSIIFLIFDLVFTISIQAQLENFKIFYFNCRITATPILLTIFSTLSLVCIFFFNKKNRKNIMEEYTMYQA